MSSHDPATNDVERLENVLALWCSADAAEDEAQADGAAHAVADDAWADEIRARIAAQAAAESEPPRAADAKGVDVEAFIRADVDRAVARYVGKFPPFVIAKLRELAERYWRENPKAAVALRVMTHKARTISGAVAVGPEQDEDLAAAGRKKA